MFLNQTWKVVRFFITILRICGRIDQISEIHNFLCNQNKPSHNMNWIEAKLKLKCYCLQYFLCRQLLWKFPCLKGALCLVHGAKNNFSRPNTRHTFEYKNVCCEQTDYFRVIKWRRKVECFLPGVKIWENISFHKFPARVNQLQKVLKAETKNCWAPFSGNISQTSVFARSQLSIFFWLLFTAQYLMFAQGFTSKRFLRRRKQRRSCGDFPTELSWGCVNPSQEFSLCSPTFCVAK